MLQVRPMLGTLGCVWMASRKTYGDDVCDAFEKISHC